MTTHSFSRDTDAQSTAMHRFPQGLLPLLAAAALLVPPTGRAETELGYEPTADPFAQLKAAKSAAAERGRPILVIAGGDWCIWCHYLDAFLHERAELGAALKETFVVTKVYIGDEENNADFFATLPEAAGYPHFWILAADGSLLESQDTLPLEDGDKSYDPASFRAFIDRWAGTPAP